VTEAAAGKKLTYGSRYDWQADGVTMSLVQVVDSLMNRVLLSLYTFFSIVLISSQPVQRPEDQ
jgi:hypothetical protein